MPTRGVSFIEYLPQLAHPSLEARKQVVARLLIARSFAQLLPRGTGQVRAEQRRALQAAAEHAATYPRPSAGCPSRLDEHLAQVAAVLVQEGNRSGFGQAEQISQSFDADRGKIDCCACASRRLNGQAVGLAQHSLDLAVCRDAEHDDENLTTDGQCWALFRGLFRFVLDLVRDAYGPLLPVSDGPASLAVGLRTEIAADGELGGATTFPSDSGAARQAEILLLVPTEEFQPHHYFRSLYVLLHEVGVHAPEAWTAPESRRPENELCAFREGFVDAAVARLLLAVLEDANHALPASHAPFRWRFQQETKAAFHRRRDRALVEPLQQLERHEKAKAVIENRAYGTELFERLLALRGKHDAGAACEAILLALRLNLLPLSRKQRERLLAEVDLVTSLGAAERSPRQTAWLAALLKFGRLGDKAPEARATILRLLG